MTCWLTCSISKRHIAKGCNTPLCRTFGWPIIGRWRRQWCCFLFPSILPRIVTFTTLLFNHVAPGHFSGLSISRNSTHFVENKWVSMMTRLCFTSNKCWDPQVNNFGQNIWCYHTYRRCFEQYRTFTHTRKMLPKTGSKSSRVSRRISRRSNSGLRGRFLVKSLFLFYHKHFSGSFLFVITAIRVLTKHTRFVRYLLDRLPLPASNASWRWNRGMRRCQVGQLSLMKKLFLFKWWTCTISDFTKTCWENSFTC